MVGLLPSCELRRMSGTATQDVETSPPSPPTNLSPITTQGQKSFGGAGEQYELEEVLGEGSYGSVYRCRRNRDSAVFAVKVIDPLRLGFVGGSRAIRAAEAMAVREVDALRRLAAHPGIISLEGAFFSQATRQIFIVTDFLPGSHLFSHVVQRNSPLQEFEAAHVVAQVADALSFCHSLGMVHRDLKLENVLVAGVNVSLAEVRIGETMSWRTQELFSVKICDFGFAKSLLGYTTRTPVGTHTYAAPEVKGENPDGESKGCDTTNYDAFKADAYSLGVMIFVMLCLGFPVKDGSEGSHRRHKVWPTLSANAQSLIDGLLEFDPSDRLSVVEVCDHMWVESSDPFSPKTRCSKKKLLGEAEAEWESSRRSPKPRWRMDEDPVLPAVLSLQRALVHIQQERGMALWALAGAPGMDGISCWDQFQWHVQLSEKRLHEAKGMLEKRHLKSRMESTLITLATNLTKARQLVHNSTPTTPNGNEEKRIGSLHEVPFDSCDAIFFAYNEAGTAVVDFIAHCLEDAKPESSEGRRAGRRFRLFSAAAEQLSRQRAFMCGLATATDRSCELQQHGARLPMEKLQKLSEIIGSRKILLGTVVDGATTSSYTVATSTGLLSGLIGDGEPSLLSAADIAELESLEARVLSPSVSHSLPTEEWYRTLTRLLNEIHSRIAITLVDDMRMPELQLPGQSMNTELRLQVGNSGNTESLRSHPTKRDICHCRAGLKKLLQSMVDRL